jgi:hypothetical protein
MIEKYIPKFMDILYEDDIKSKLTFNELRDAFHTNQILSKNDAIIGFSKLPKTSYKNVLYLGSWLGVLTKFLCDEYTDYDFSQMDFDNKFDIISNRLLKNTNNYKEYINEDVALFENFKNYSTILHLSVTDNSKWFDKLDSATEVVLQSTKFDNINEMKSKYPLSYTHYENTIELNVYNRFTLVGRK